jgi:hypothetical protein
MLYLVHVDSGSISFHSHVNDFNQGGKIVHIVNHGPGELDLVVLPDPIVSIVEVSNPDELWPNVALKQFNAMPFGERVFLYCQTNPIRMLGALLSEGYDIEWFNSAVSYAEGNVSWKKDCRSASIG